MRAKRPIPRTTPGPGGTAVSGERAEGKLRLRGWLGLRDGFDAAFTRIVDHARGQVATGETDPTAAIHSYRKSIRRARAMLRLGVPFLRRVEIEPLDDALRAALALGSSLRDADVLLGTLDRFARPSDRDAAGPRTSRPSTPRAGARGRGPAPDATLTRVVARTRAVLAHEITTTRADGAARHALAAGAAALAPLPARFSASLPPAIRTGDLEAGLARLFRRAAGALRRARKESEDARIHAFRKRVKELRYALELVGEGTDGASSAAKRSKGPAERTAAALAEGLGEITDLIVLRRFLRAAHDRIGPDSHRLEAALGNEIARRFAHIARGAAPFLAGPPRALAREAVRGDVRPGRRRAPAKVVRRSPPA